MDLLVTTKDFVDRAFPYVDRLMLGIKRRILVSPCTIQTGQYPYNQFKVVVDKNQLAGIFRALSQEFSKASILVSPFGLALTTYALLQVLKLPGQVEVETLDDVDRPYSLQAKDVSSLFDLPIFRLLRNQPLTSLLVQSAIKNFGRKS